MNLNVFVFGGGIFSHFHQFLRLITSTVSDISLYSQFRILVVHNQYITNTSIFDSVFHYDKIETFEPQEMKSFSPGSNMYLRVNLYSHYSLLKQICSRMKFHDSILNTVDLFTKTSNINSNALGDHIRLTDMNTRHPEYGVFTIGDYIYEIKDYLSKNPSITTIFVASDNSESIEKVKNELPHHNVVSFGNKYIVDRSDDDNFRNQIDNLNNPDFYQQNVIEALILSKCGALIHRISDFANFAILFSTTFKDIRCLNV